jgi:CNT family concentrative nucleoside transporter
VLLKLPPVAKAFGAINDAVSTIAAATRAGTSFVFGYLGGGALPFDLKAPARISSWRFRRCRSCSS